MPRPRHAGKRKRIFQDWRVSGEKVTRVLQLIGKWMKLASATHSLSIFGENSNAENREKREPPIGRNDSCSAAAVAKRNSSSRRIINGVCSRPSAGKIINCHNWQLSPCLPNTEHRTLATWRCRRVVFSAEIWQPSGVHVPLYVPLYVP